MRKNTFIKSSLLLSAFAAGCFATSVFAAPTQIVPFVIAQSGGGGNFYCVAQGSGNVTLNTHQLDAQGFCSGPNPGHLTITADQLNKYNFAVRRDDPGYGHIEVVSDDSVTDMKCNTGTDPSRADYAPSASYCAIAPQK